MLGAVVLAVRSPRVAVLCGPPLAGKAVTERELQDAVIECARLLGWRCAHFRPAQTAKGWRTPVEADGQGWPDLTLVHRGRSEMLFVELKSEKGKLSPAQERWLADLGWCSSAGVHVWRPRDWLDGTVEKVLRG